jgi:co-chaperonin GroES (HSP10)
MIPEELFLYDKEGNLKGDNMTTATQKATSYVEAMQGRILVKPDEFKYGGKIVIPDKVQRRPTVGTIVQLSLTEDNNPNKFEVGQRVVYGVYSGTPVLLTIDQVETPLIVLTPEEILVRLHGSTELKEAGQGY